MRAFIYYIAAVARFESGQTVGQPRGGIIGSKISGGGGERIMIIIIIIKKKTK